MSDDPTLVEALHKAQQELARCRLIIAQHEISREEVWVELVGREAVDLMLQSKEATIQFLQHPQTNYRLAALGIMGSCWKPAPTFDGVCEQMALQDPDERVRTSALILLGSCYSSTSDARVSRLLASVVRNETESTSRRVLAYQALFDVDGLPPSIWPTTRIATGLFCFPDDIDWAYVDHFLSGSK